MSTIFCSYIVALLISRLYVYASPVSLEPVGLAAPNFPTFKRSEEFNDIDDSSLDQLFSQSATFEPDPQNDTINSQETVTASPITLLVDPQDENIAQSIFDSDNQPHTMTIENASDDPNLSNIYCTTDIPEKSAVTLIQKRDLTAKNPDNACPVRPMNFIPPGTYSNPGNPTRPSLKPQPPPPVVDQQTSSDADRCIKSPAFAGAEERYTVHVSCGGPKVGGFPSDPDFVLNCTPGVATHIPARTVFAPTTIISQFCCVEHRNSAIFWIAHECYEIPNTETTEFELEVWTIETFKEFRDEVIREIERQKRDRGEQPFH